MWWEPDSLGSWLAFLIGTACWLTTVGLVLWAIVRIAGNRSGGSPLEIARSRLARGEITREQFEDLENAVR